MGVWEACAAHIAARTWKEVMAAMFWEEVGSKQADRS